MVNENFYQVTNDMFTEITGGTLTNIYDRTSFISAGTELLSTMSTTDIANAFASAIANKVQLSLNVIRELSSKLGYINKGTLVPEGVLEMINHGFMDARKAEFAHLTDGQSVDMYEINKGDTKADYYCKSNAEQIVVTIGNDEIKGALKSPESMDSFYQGKIQYALNSKNLAVTNARRGLIAEGIAETVDGTYKETSPEATSPKGWNRYYKALSIYNAIHNTNLTKDECLYNKDFLRFLTGLIRKVSRYVQNPTTKFNATNSTVDKFVGFTPASDVKTLVVSEYADNVGAYLTDESFRTDFDALNVSEVIDFWEMPEQPMTVRFGDNDEDVTGDVVAVVHDDLALMEFTQIDDTSATPYNSAGRYTNIWVNWQYAYYLNRKANFVIFTLE